MLLAYLAGKKEGGASASAEATATATAEARSRARAEGGRSQSAVNVILAPPGVDAAALAAQLGTRAYQVEAPPEVASDFPAQALAARRQPVEVESVQRSYAYDEDSHGVL